MKTKTEILDNYSKEVGLINFKNAVKHVWLKQWSCTALIRLVERAMEEYRSQPSGQKKSTENIKDFVKKFMQSYEPDTFIPNKYGQYVYRSENGASGLNLVAFFEDLLDEYAQSHQVEMPSDGNLARNLHNWSDTHLDGDITLKDCYELINYFETLRKSGTLTLIK